MAYYNNIGLLEQLPASSLPVIGSRKPLAHPTAFVSLLQIA